MKSLVFRLLCPTNKIIRLKFNNQDLHLLNQSASNMMIKVLLPLAIWKEWKNITCLSASGGDQIHKKIIVKTDGKHTTSDENSYVFISENGDQTKVKVVNGEKVIEEIHGPHSENVWVSESGDSTKLKRIEIIEIDEENGGEKQVFIKKMGDGEDDDVEVIINGSGDVHKGHDKMIFISDDGEKPLMIVDGKEVEGGSLEDIDSDRIETVNVYKGDKAIEKYGEKAKNGVVIINTKK